VDETVERAGSKAMSTSEGFRRIFTTNHTNQRERRQDFGIKVRGVRVVRGKIQTYWIAQELHGGNYFD